MRIEWLSARRIRVFFSNPHRDILIDALQKGEIAGTRFQDLVRVSRLIRLCPERTDRWHAQIRTTG